MTFDLRTIDLHERYPLTTTNSSRALRIISERSTKGETRDLLLDDLACKDDKIRRGRALTALNFLVSNRACMQAVLSTSKSPVLTSR
jgi:hypothetical protein